MKVSHEYTRKVNFPVVWMERSDDETMQPLFVALQDDCPAVFALDLLKDWAQQVADEHESFPRENPLDMSGSYSSLVMQKPGGKDWIPVTVEVKPSGRQLLIRYTIDGARVCDSHLLEG